MNKSIIMAMTLAIIAGLGMTSIPVSAGDESVIIPIWWNVNSADELSVKILSAANTYGGWNLSVSGGTAMGAQIEFNTSTTDSAWLNATTRGATGATQDIDDGIIIMDNTGTTVVAVNVSIANDTRSCMQLSGSLTYDDSPASGPTNISSAGWALNASYEPTDQALELWLWGNFSNCITTDTSVTDMYINITS